jgi:hypothetical protein
VKSDKRMLIVMILKRANYKPDARTLGASFLIRHSAVSEYKKFLAAKIQQQTFNFVCNNVFEIRYVTDFLKALLKVVSTQSQQK